MKSECHDDGWSQRASAFISGVLLLPRRDPSRAGTRLA
jgi:hypothetical protein